MINGRTEASVSETCRMITHDGLDVAGCVADVSNPDASSRLVAATIERFGRLDVLINNAGLTSRGPVSEARPEAVERIVSTNFLGAVYTTQAALRLTPQTLTTILFVSSLAALRGAPNAGLYAASKMALTALAECLRAELRPTGTRVCVCYVGFTENDGEKRMISSTGRPVPITAAFRPAHSQQQTARFILRCVHRRRFKAVQGPVGKLLRLACILAPGLVDAVFRGAARRIR